MSNQFQVAVIGGGPAGLVAAIRLARAGQSVALFEKKSYPRVKTCGDLVTWEGLKILSELGLADWMEGFRRVDALRFVAPDGQVLDVSVCDPSAPARNRILPREHLDTKLAEVARESGVRLMSGLRVHDLEVDAAEGAAVHARTGVIRADVVILADGSQSPVTRKMGLISGVPDLIAARQYVKMPGIADDAPLEFHFQEDILPGYVWLFPEGDGVVNVGCGTYTSRVKEKEINLQTVVESFLASNASRVSEEGEVIPLGIVKAHLLRTRLRQTRTHGSRFLVVGDAAGLVSPFTGEGIASGMLSGAAAASVMIRAREAGDFSAEQLSLYTNLIRERFDGDHQAAYVLRRVLGAPRILNHYFRRMRANAELAELFALTYVDEKSPQLLLHPRNLLKAL
ncbi:MAG: NAD(P)/FAD-dependent oxidoreductase [Anaerolineaceae bacterium]|nr:NAD(P)/FAD-dependent oxidoreductase [Anaerolineaceae bacterium]